MRLRITFARLDALRYIGHLDLHQVWERTIRRAGLPLAYTQGFHPGPRMQVAAALPLGFIGLEEIIDIWLLEAPADSAVLQASLQAATPPGLRLLRVEAVDERLPALQTQVIAADYDIELLDSHLQPAEAVARLLQVDSLPRERRAKKYDLRPLIQDLRLSPGRLHLRLSAMPGATGRPEEVLAELGIPLEDTRITRTRLVFQDNVK